MDKNAWEGCRWLWQGERGGEEFPGETEPHSTGRPCGAGSRREARCGCRRYFPWGARGPLPGGGIRHRALAHSDALLMFAQHLTQRAPCGEKLNLPCNFGYSHLLIHCLLYIFIVLG